MQSLIIVESPTKSKTIQSFLGKDYKVLSSFGHVRDLPSSTLGVDIEKNFEPKYVVPPKAKPKVKILKDETKKSDEVILASVDYNEPILIADKKNTINQYKVGEFIDKAIDENFNLEKFKIPAFDFKSHKITFKNIKAVSRHPISEPLLEVSLDYGRRLKITASHSVFTKNKNGKIKEVAGKSLRIGDRLLIPTKLPNARKTIKEIDLLKEIYFNKNLCQKVFINSPVISQYRKEKVLAPKIGNFYQFQPRLIFSTDLIKNLRNEREKLGISQKALSEKVGCSQPQVCDWEQGNANPTLEFGKKYLSVLGYDLQTLSQQEVQIAPSSIQMAIQNAIENQWNDSRKSLTHTFQPLSRFTWEEIEKNFENDKEIEISRHNHIHKMPRFIPVNSDLMIFLGFFIAEGSYQQNAVKFSFGNKKIGGENDNIETIKNISKKIFNHSPSDFFDRTSNSIVLSSSLISFLMKDVFKIMGHSYEKTVPWIVFNVPTSLQFAFLKGLFLGDGSLGKENIVFNTVSKSLAQGIRFILLQNNILNGHTVCVPKRKNRKPMHFIAISGKTKLEATKQIWQDHYKSKSIENYLKNGSQNKKGFSLIEEQKEDLGLLKIKSIKTITPSTNMVYDFSVEGENFICGDGGVCAHNTDEDREGEAIAWHLAEVLKLKKPKRIIFHEITKTAIEKALANPRKIDFNLVNAQQARRILDRLVGYKLSPFLWKKIMRGLSAGRVQSVAVRLICDKENEIKNFISVEYWSIEAKLFKNKDFLASLIAKNGKPIDKLEIKNKQEADKILNGLEGAQYIVDNVEKKEASRNPQAPFTTSTLQQTAVNKFGWGAKRTMAIAQKLYEKGLCVDENSLIINEKGEIYRIKELENNNKETLVGINEQNLEVISAKVSKFWKIKSPQKMVSIETSSHEKILITPDHPLMVIRNGQPIWVQGKHIKSTDYLAIAESIRVQRQKIASTLLEIIENMSPDDQNKIYFIFSEKFFAKPKLSSLKAKRNIIHYSKIKELLTSKIISYNFIKKYYQGIAASNSRAVKFQKIDLNFSSEMGYLLGLMVGDGHLEKKRQCFSLSCKCKSEKALTRLNLLIGKIFNEPFNKLNTKGISYRLNSTFLYLLFQYLGAPVGNKSAKIDITNMLLKQPDSVLKSYIAGLWDSDGCIVKSWKNSIRLSYSSKSEIFIDKLRLLLKTFGMNSAKHEDKRNKVYCLLLTSQAVKKFRDCIVPYLIIKKEVWESIYSLYGQLYKTRVISKCQGVPTIAPLLEKLLAQNKIPKQRLSNLLGIDLFNYFGKIKKDHTRLPFIPKSILEKISKFIDTPEGLLSLLGKSSVVWEKIEKIQYLPYKKMYVYDVTTSTNTFIVNGIISHNCTYHRTDSLNLSVQSQMAAKQLIIDSFGKNYWPGFARSFKTKSKSAQEAHEAIRPTFPANAPEQLKAKKLMPEELKLYTLVWQRFIASQMSQAVFDTCQINITANQYGFRATGQTMKFDGFLKVYPIKFEEMDLPELIKGEVLELKELISNQHFTQPPARYSEATLIKVLEKEGIGRPSTYAPILDTIQQRNYVEKDENKRLKPTQTGVMVNEMLTEHFPEIVDIQFTAKMEEELDEIARGKDTWQKTLKDFYMPFEKNLKQKEKEVEKKDLTEETDKICPQCQSPMVIRLGRFGKFYACKAFPNCKHTEPIPKPSLGIECPKCGQGEIVEKTTRSKKTFFGCSIWPKCDFALWDKPIDEKCPQCQSIMVENKRKKIICSNKNCPSVIDAKSTKKLKKKI